MRCEERGGRRNANMVKKKGKEENEISVKKKWSKGKEREMWCEERWRNANMERERKREE